MMKRKALWSFILAFVLALPAIGTVLAAPGLPAAYLGTVTVNGANVPDGTEVTAWINGTQYASTTTQMYNSESWYGLDVPGDDPDTSDVVEGGVAGDTIVFKIDGQEADQTATWQSGSSSDLNLTVDDGGDGPTADFTCTPTSGSASLEVTCTDASTGNITGWSWDFGDGTTSTDQNPAAHTYNANGTYTVSLTVTGPDGDDTESKADYISLSDSSTALTCDDVEVYPNDTIAVSLMAQGTNVYGLQTTVAVSDPALVDIDSATFGDFFSQPLAMASNQKEPTTDNWLGGASQQNPNGPISGQGRFATLLYKAGNTTGSVTLTITSLFSDRDGATIPSEVSTCVLTIQPFGDTASTVTYQGRSDHANIDVTVAGPTAKSVTSNTSGAFTIDQLRDGDTYQVTADAQSYLPACTTATVTVVSGQTTALSSTQLRGGDLNDDLIINIGDAARLMANFNNPASADTQADINADGTINIGDWSILQGNYDLTGCQSWPS